MSDAKHTELRVHDDGANVHIVSTVGANECNVIADVFADDFRADEDGHAQALDRAARMALAANCHDELVAVLRCCEMTITEICESEAPTSTDWVNIRAARHLARAALAKAETKP